MPNNCRYSSPSRGLPPDWGFSGVGGGGGGLLPSAIPSSVAPATADVIAAQSQDYVDENLAAFQVSFLCLIFSTKCVAFILVLWGTQTSVVIAMQNWQGLQTHTTTSIIPCGIFHYKVQQFFQSTK